MSVTELITQKVSSLPDIKQVEVLDFIEFLLQKAEPKPEQTLEDWSRVSLILAMQGLEDDEMPEYTLADLKEHWQ